MKGSPIRHNRLYSLLFSLAAIMAVGTVLLAPSPDGGVVFAQSKADIEKAKKAFREGKELYGQEKYLEAAKAFERAFELSNRNELLYNVGRSYWKANKLKKAETYLQKYLNAMPDAPNADDVVEAIIQIQEEMAAQMANVKVEASQSGIDILVDQETEPRCQTPCTVSLMPGEHTLVARAEGMTPATKSVTVEPEQQTSVSFNLPGRLHVRTDQRAGSVTVDGSKTYSLPMDEPVALPAGEHQLTVVGSEGNKWTGAVDITSGQVSRILVPMAPLDAGGNASTLRIASYSLWGASAGFLVGGIVLGMQASDTHDALAAREKSSGAVDPKMVEQGQSEQFGANLMYTLSAVSAASGAGLFVWDMYGGSSAEEDIPPSESSAKADAGEASGEDGDLLQIGAGAQADGDQKADEADSKSSPEKQKKKQSDKGDDELELF